MKGLGRQSLLWSESCRCLRRCRRLPPEQRAELTLLERILTFSYLPKKRLPGLSQEMFQKARQWKIIYLARHLPVKKASTAGIEGGRRRRIAKQWSRKAEPRKAPSKRKCRKKKISKTYLQDSKMMSARKITARIQVTTGISFAFLPAHFAIT